MFEQAARNKFRFTSPAGELTAEQLWDLPLKAKNNLDLDTVAKTANSALKAATEESFVTTATAANDLLALKLDIVKHIIAVKQKEAAAVRDRADRLAQKQKLVELLSDKTDEALKNLTPAEIAKRIEDLGV